MRCVILAVGLHWDSGNSVSLQFKAIADELVRRGYRVVLLVPGQLTDKVIDTGNPLVFTWPSKRPTKLQDAIFLYRIIRKYRPFSIVGNFAAVNWVIVVGWLLQVKNRIAWYHTLVEQSELDNHENAIVRIFYWARKLLVYKLATSIVAVSDYAMREDLTNKYHVPARKITVFHNLLKTPVDLCPSAQENVNLVCVGRMDYSKAHDVLIKAMQHVAARFPEVTLRLIGSGKRKKDLEEMAKTLKMEKNVVFVGSIKPEDVLMEFAKSYACIHPARIDNCPLVLIESISVGTPVIASNAGGIPEIIRDDIDGLLTPPGNSEALGLSICKILESAELRQRYSENAKSRFLSEFDLGQGVAKIVTWLESQIYEE
ncbi:MAG: glycosyltransferase family 4 protein [Anaerolineales bacterium]|nr:MAG: glycosyltransferase family 4 protein [Anaerolineales bacterium]